MLQVHLSPAHILQPLEVAVFGPMLWLRKMLSEWKEQITHKGITMPAFLSRWSK